MRNRMIRDSPFHRHPSTVLGSVHEVLVSERCTPNRSDVSNIVIRGYSGVTVTVPLARKSNLSTRWFSGICPCARIQQNMALLVAPMLNAMTTLVGSVYSFYVRRRKLEIDDQLEQPQLSQHFSGAIVVKNLFTSTCPSTSTDWCQELLLSAGKRSGFQIRCTFADAGCMMSDGCWHRCYVLTSVITRGK